LPANATIYSLCLFRNCFFLPLRAECGIKPQELTGGAKHRQSILGVYVLVQGDSYQKLLGGSFVQDKNSCKNKSKNKTRA
ncbi:MULTISPECIES: hypothetical protein, partial [Pseudanabaena]